MQQYPHWLIFNIFILVLTMISWRLHILKHFWPVLTTGNDNLFNLKYYFFVKVNLRQNNKNSFFHQSLPEREFLESTMNANVTDLKIFTFLSIDEVTFSQHFELQYILKCQELFRTARMNIVLIWRFVDVEFWYFDSLFVWKKTRQTVDQLWYLLLLFIWYT